MKEIEDIIQAFDKAQQQGKQTALATVVQVEGSSYRRPGARMLVTEDGQLTGAISGGCLEGDALRKALLVMSRQQPMLVTYDTTDEDDAKLGVGLGCNGVIQVLIEPIRPEVPANPVQLLKQVAAKRQKAVLITLFSLHNRNAVQPGTCLLQTDNENLFGGIQNNALQSDLLADAQEVFINKASYAKDYITEEGHFTAFLEFVKPAVSLIIAGAGNDALPLMTMAHVLGWQITIVDGRPNYATAQRFPLAHHVIVAKPEKVLSVISMDEQTVFILMTHNYNYDRAMLKHLIASNCVYTGILGPRKRMERILQELQDEGIYISKEQSSKLYGPVGLDIGAETAEEIALSILAEVKAVLSNREGQFLRNSSKPIHAPADPKG